MRSTNATESESCDPPEPRLKTLCPGKACATAVQRRMVELPMNRIASWGGGLVLSAASKARISCSHRASGGCFFSAAVWANRERLRAAPIARASHVLDQGNRERMTEYGESPRPSSKGLFGLESPNNRLLLSP